MTHVEIHLWASRSYIRDNSVCLSTAVLAKRRMECTYPYSVASMVASSNFSIGHARSNRPGTVAYGIPLNEWTVVPSLVMLDVPMKVVWRVLWWIFGRAISTRQIIVRERHGQ